mgnify:FL=1
MNASILEKCIEDSFVSAIITGLRVHLTHQDLVVCTIFSEDGFEVLGGASHFNYYYAKPKR